MLILLSFPVIPILVALPSMIEFLVTAYFTLIPLVVIEMLAELQLQPV